MSTLHRRRGRRHRTEAGHAKRRASLDRQLAAVNPDSLCSAPGCTDKVAPSGKLSGLCVMHMVRLKKTGHPFVKTPWSGDKDLQAARQAVENYLTSLNPAQLLSFEACLSYTIRNHLREPASNALSLSSLRREKHSLSQRGESQVYWAHLGIRKDFEKVARRIVLDAMAMLVWSRAFYFQLDQTSQAKRRLPRFLNTTIGRFVTMTAGRLREDRVRLVPDPENPGGDWVETEEHDVYVTPTGVRAWCGRRVYDNLHHVLPKSWPPDEVVADCLSIYEILSPDALAGSRLG